MQVSMDESGMLPSSLRAVLAATPPSPVTGRPPRVMYIIPSGQNPTGAVMPLSRKQEIYQARCLFCLVSFCFVLFVFLLLLGSLACSQVL
jgi:hypothetical protein